jgi:flagellar biosynthetic protein FliQ
MNEEEIIELIRQTIMMCIELSAPVMLVGLVVGTSIALIQALTQIQEVTLVFVPKILSIFFALFVALPMMATSLIEFMEFLADKIIAIR